MLVLLLLLLLAVSPAAGAEPDAALLERVEQLRAAARQLAPQLWPGWDPLATPLAIHKGKEMGVLIGHPAPPRNFRRLATPLVSVPVFVSDSTAGMVLANTAQPFAGTLTSFFSYDDFMGKPLPQALALAMHELFHAYLNRTAPEKTGNILVMLWGAYPEFSAHNRVLLALEAQTLSEGMAASGTSQALTHTAGFLGIRAERRKELAPELARYESGEESSEGLARYIELRTLQLLPSIGPSYSEAAAAAEQLIGGLKQINTLPRDRERFYVLGMAQAALLDRVRPGWKQEFTSTPLLLDGLLSQAASPLSTEETAKLLDKFSYRKLMNEQEKAVAARLLEGEQRLARLFAAGGERVVIEVGALKNNISLRGINPNGSVMLSSTLVAHTFLLLDLGGQIGPRMQLEFRGIPAVYDRGEEALWCILPRGAVEKGMEQWAKSLGAQAARLELKASGFSGVFSGVQVERRGNELRIRPAEFLNPAPRLKAPESVRP